MALANIRTRTVTVQTVPLDIAADVDIQTELLTKGKIQIALQNITSGRLVFNADRPDQPAQGSRDGLILRYGSAIIYEVDRGDRIWCWTSSSLGASVTVNGAG